MGASSTRVAFISDVHSNLEALQAVLSSVDAPDIYCLGDIVGYGASPNEVIALLMERGVKCIRGNHDQAVITANTSGFNPRAGMAVAWTARRLTKESKTFLESLPLERKIVLRGRTRVYMTHGSPDDHLWEYVHVLTHSDLFEHYLTKTASDVMALGHTHVPFVWREKKGVVFNPGSVGQPRNGDVRASYALVEFSSSHGSDDIVVDLRQRSYDVKLAASKIVEAGLPESNARRLFVP